MAEPDLDHDEKELTPVDWSSDPELEQGRPVIACRSIG
jgi:hypothetical protein